VWNLGEISGKKSLHHLVGAGEKKLKNQTQRREKKEISSKGRGKKETGKRGTSEKSSLN